MNNFNHLNDAGAAHMVDISDKDTTVRTATAHSIVDCNESVIQQLKDQENPKGDVFATARIAGIQAAKKCSDLIPLCHPLPLNNVTIELRILDLSVVITAHCKTQGKTGIEMEALTAASVAALTFYDMCKAIDKNMVIRDTRLLEKTGGKSGDFKSNSSQIK